MQKPPIQIGRYDLCDELARGGMATVHLGRLLGPVGFARTVAIKRLHPHLATDPAFVAMLLDEARLAARIQHPNVASTIDVVAKDGELFVVMEYLHGEALSRLLRAAHARGQRVPPNIAVAIVVGALTGLHAAHEAVRETGEPLGLVHRDVSPQNIMIRREGTAVVVDFGVAKAAGRFQVTEEGQIKGKLPYMAAEQLRGLPFTRRVDIYAASAVLWETLVGERLVKGASEGEVLERLLFDTFPSPGSLVEGLPAALDAVIMKGLARNAEERWATAREMALALEDALPPATPARVATWLDELVGDALREREKRVAAIESGVARATDPGEPLVPTEASIRADAATSPTRAATPQSIAGASADSAAPASMSKPPPIDDFSTASAEAPTLVAAVVRSPRPSPIDSAPILSPPRPSRAWLAGLALVSLGGIATIAAFTNRSAAPTADASAVPAPPASAALPASADPSASAPPSASAAPSPPPAASTTAPVSPPPPPRTAPPEDCNPPYNIINGKRIYKRRCLR